MKIEKVNLTALKDFLPLEENNNVYYAISFETRIFGYIEIEINDVVNIKQIYIKEEFRNSSFGSKLLNFAIYDLINQNIDEIYVLKHKKINNFLEKNDFICVNNIYVRKNLKKEIEDINISIKISKFSIVINIILSILKLLIGVIFKVNVLIADGINSFSDLINNILVLIGAKIDKNPNDEEHPFGHGKIESIFSLIIGMIIIFSSLSLLKESIMNMYNNKLIVYINNYLIIIFFSISFIIIKLLQYIYVLYYSKKYNNQLIKAMVVDYNLDIILSIIALITIILSNNINYYIDFIISTLISIYLIYLGCKLVKENSMILMDSQDKNIILSVKTLTLEVDEIKNIHDVYMTRIGKKIYIVADIRISSKVSLERAHEISEIAEKKIKFRHSNIKKVIYHIEPLYDE